MTNKWTPRYICFWSFSAFSFRVYFTLHWVFLIFVYFSMLFSEGWYSPKQFLLHFVSEYNHPNKCGCKSFKTNRSLLNALLLDWMWPMYSNWIRYAKFAIIHLKHVRKQTYFRKYPAWYSSSIDLLLLVRICFVHSSESSSFREFSLTFWAFDEQNSTTLYHSFDIEA